MPRYNIYEISPPRGADNVDPEERPRRVLAGSEKQAIDFLQAALVFDTCFRSMKLHEVPWLSEDVECVMVEENVDNPDNVAKILEH